MEVNIVTPEDLEAFRERLLEDIKKMIAPKQERQYARKIKSTEVRKLLDISPGKLHTLRVNGSLKAKKVGGTFYYDYDEVMKLIE